MIHVIATVELNDGKLEAFLAEFRRLVPQVLAERGCLEYAPAVDVPTGLAAQGGARPNTVTVVERWTDLPALEAHLCAPHMVEYRPRVKEFVKGVKLQILQPV